MPTLNSYVPRDGTGGVIDIDTVERPQWLRGRNQAALIVRNEVFFDLHEPAGQIGHNVLSTCGLCWETMDHMGAQAEHLTEWRHFAKHYWDNNAPPTTHRELEDAYHEAGNIYAGHGGCNASKGSGDVFEWWRSANCDVYVDLGRRTRLRHILTALHRDDIDLLCDFPLVARKTALKAIQLTASDANWGNRDAWMKEIRRLIPEL